MNRLTIKKFVAYLSVVFVLGAVTGASFAWNAASRQHRHRPPPNPKGMTDFMKGMLQSRLALTSDQANAIDPFIETFSRDVNAMQAESSKNFEAIVARFHANINPLLTPEQRVKLQELDQERRDRFKHRGPKPDQPRARGCAPGSPDPSSPVQTSFRDCPHSKSSS